MKTQLTFAYLNNQPNKSVEILLGWVTALPPYKLDFFQMA